MKPTKHKYSYTMNKSLIVRVDAQYKEYLTKRDISDQSSIKHGSRNIEQWLDPNSSTKFIFRQILHHIQTKYKELSFQFFHS